MILTIPEQLIYDLTDVGIRNADASVASVIICLRKSVGCEVGCEDGRDDG